jgi:hypothetical protein
MFKVELTQLVKPGQHAVSFRVNTRAQSAGEGLTEIYTRCIRSLAKSKTSVHPANWPVDTAHVPLWTYAPQFDV